MALHFSRGGLLVPFIFIVSCVLVVLGVELTVGYEAVSGYRWPNCLIFFLSGTGCWLLRTRFRTENKEISINRGSKWTDERSNTFWFLSFKAWAFIFYSFMLYHLFKPVPFSH